MTDTSMTTEADNDAFLTQVGGDIFGEGAATTETVAAEEKGGEVVTEVAATTEAATTEVAEATQTETEQAAATGTETATEAAAETTAQTQTQTEDETEEEPQGGKVPQMRFRPVNDDRTIQAAKLMKAGLSYDEIQDVLAKRSGNPAEPEQEEGPDIGAMQARKVELDNLIKQAGEDGSVMTVELAQAIQERSEIAADIKLAQRDVEARAQARAQEQQNAYNDAFEESTAAVVEIYPDAENPNSELSRRISAEVQQILDNPEHPLRGNPEAPMILAVKHARALGAAPQTGPRPSAASPAPATAAAPNPTALASKALTEAALPRAGGLTPSTGASRTAPPGPVPTAQQAEAEIQRKIAEAKTEEEAAGLLAVGLFGAAAPVNPFA